MADPRLKYIYILVVCTLIGFGGSNYIESRTDPITFKVQEVELMDTNHENGLTLFTFSVEFASWNERYLSIRISYPISCGIQAGIYVEPYRGFQYNGPFCAEGLEITSTRIAPGLTEYQDEVTVAFEGNKSSLPSGNYIFFTYPEYQDSSGRLEYRVDDTGDVDIEAFEPENFGESTIIRTPLTWYLPAYAALILTIWKQIRYFIEKQYETGTMQILTEKQMKYLDEQADQDTETGNREFN